MAHVGPSDEIIKIGRLPDGQPFIVWSCLA